VKSEQAAGGVARCLGAYHEDDERHPGHEHRRRLGLAAAQHEPDEEAGERDDDDEVTKALVPAQPHVVASQEPAGKRRLGKNAEPEDLGEDPRRSGAATRCASRSVALIRLPPC
jgi:hypothetical protein